MTDDPKTCPLYKAAILAAHDFTRPLQDRERRELEGAIRRYARCDGVSCELAIVKRERNEGNVKKIFLRCGRR